MASFTGTTEMLPPAKIWENNGKNVISIRH